MVVYTMLYVGLCCSGESGRGRHQQSGTNPLAAPTVTAASVAETAVAAAAVSAAERRPAAATQHRWQQVAASHITPPHLTSQLVYSPSMFVLSRRFLWKVWLVYQAFGIFIWFLNGYGHVLLKLKKYINQHKNLINSVLLSTSNWLNSFENTVAVLSCRRRVRTHPGHPGLSWMILDNLQLSVLSWKIGFWNGIFLFRICYTTEHWGFILLFLLHWLGYYKTFLSQSSPHFC